jgi:hypothetical protein
VRLSSVTQPVFDPAEHDPEHPWKVQSFGSRVASSFPVVIVYLLMANAVVPAKSYIVEMGTDVVGADVTHHLVKLVLVIKLS